MGLENLLNAASLAGWAAVLAVVVRRLANSHHPGVDVFGGGVLACSALVLELLCASDVGRMLVGNLRGNWMVGLPLHYTRLFVMLTILPQLRNGGNVAEMILLAWSLTEACRYPLYLFPSRWTTLVRNAVPMLTFPLGAGAEAYACFLFAIQDGGPQGAAAYLAAAQVFINVVLGSTLVYPGIVKRGLSWGRKQDRPHPPEKAPPAKGTLFPPDGKGGRRSTPTGMAVVAAALAAAGDTEGSVKCAKERVWRFTYHKHLMRLVRSSLLDPACSLAGAKAGIAYFYEHFEFADPNDPTKVVNFAANLQTNKNSFETGIVRGQSPSAKHDYRVPFNGGWHPSSTARPKDQDALTGQALKAQLQQWVAGGIMEADAAAGVAWTADYFDAGHDLASTYFVLIGAGSAMGPFSQLLELGANVVAVDIPGSWGKGGARPSSGLWSRLLATARASPGGSLTFPLARPQSACEASDLDLCEAAGCNLLEQPAEVANWLAAWQQTIPADAKVVIGNYTYLDGENHVKLSLCADACIARLRAVRPTTAVAFLCTPTDIHVCAKEPVDAAKKALGSGLGSLGMEKLVHLLTFGKKLQSNVQKPVKTNSGKDIFLVDGLSVAQGPNYGLAKRLQHWRAQVAYSEGATVSTMVAPSTATISVIHNKTFGWAYGGMPYFGFEIFKQETTNAVMAALLINDVLNANSPKNPKNKEAAGVDNSLELFKTQAVHGGLWRAPYKIDTLGEVCVAIYFGCFGRKLF